MWFGATTRAVAPGTEAEEQPSPADARARSGDAPNFQSLEKFTADFPNIGNPCTVSEVSGISNMAAPLQEKYENVKVPEWARDAIWYQVFPERFRNGTSANDPRVEDIGDHPLPGWQVMPWSHDWYARADWEKGVGAWPRSVYHRRFGGDLVGLREKLDYLQDLGVNAIYMNPIFWAPSLHKYDAACLHHVDPTLGPDRDGDLDLIARAGETHDSSTWIWTSADWYLRDLIQNVHARGMRIILDGVFNHAGTRFFAFQDIVKKGKRSSYKDWFRITKWHKDGTFDYLGWFGHKALPEFARTEEDLAPPVRDYIFAITRRWMDPNGDGDPSDGIDGWRLDVAFCVPHGFWKQWRRHVKSINPQAYLTAEIVGPAEDYLRGDEFDAVMNYMWLYPTLRFFCPSDCPISADQLQNELGVLQSAYPEASQYVLQNLLDSHDLGRIATVLENRLVISDWESLFRLSGCEGNPDLKTSRPSEKTYRILRQLVMFQMTYIGAPMIYYGTEVGMWGANDPDNRQPMLWDDVEYDDEVWGPHGPLARSCPRRPDKALYAFYRKAIQMRREYEPLRRGALKWVETGDPRVLAYCRTGRPDILVIFNASDEPREFHLACEMKDLWNGSRVKAGTVPVTSRGWLVLSEE